MNVTTVQNDVRSPTGQRGADIIRRPQQTAAGGQQGSQQNPSGSGLDGASKERPISRSDLASEPYPYRPGQTEPRPGGQSQNPSGEQRQNSEQGEEIQREPDPQEPSPGEWSQRFAQLQRQQRQIYQQSQQLQRFESQLREREANVRKLEETMGLAKSDPKSFIEKNGLSYEQLTDIYLNEGKPTSEHLIKSLQDEIKNLQQRLDNDQNQGREAEAQKKIEGFKSEIRDTIAKESERYQLIHAQNAFETVYEVIEAYFAKTKQETGFGIILPVAEAADYVEKDLYSAAQKILGLPKFQQRQQTAPDPEEQYQSPPRSSESPQNRSQPQRSPSRPQQSTHGQNSIVRDTSGIVGGINNLGYAQQTKRQAAAMLRFNR